jgi:hypothetical protein
MSGVPNVFGSATSSIPLSQLDVNFNTPLYIGNTSVGLGNTVTSFGNVTLTNVTISSVASAITPAQGGTGLTSFTANGVVYASSTSVLTTGSGLIFDGSNLGVGTVTPSFPNGTGVAIYNSTVPRLKFTNSTTGDTSTDGTQLLVSGSDFYIQQREAASVIIATNNINAVTVDSSSRLSINTTSFATNSQFAVQTSAGKIDITALGGGSAQIQSSGALGYKCNSGSDFEWYNGSTQQMTLDASGNLLIGVPSSTNTPVSGVSTYNTSSATQIGIGHANGTGSGTGYIVFNYNASVTGSITQSGTTAVLYNVMSDQRVKENIVDALDASDDIDAIKVRSFDFIADKSNVKYGFIAQELVTVAPDAVHQPENPDDMMGVDYSKLVPMMLKEIQSLRKRLATLEAKVGA